MSDIATTRIVHASGNTSSAARHRSWIWPLPKLDGIAPCVLSSFGRRPDCVEIGYPDRISSPERVPVFAVQDGAVVYASSAQGTPLLCVDHAGGWSTQYAELEHLLVRPTDRFRGRRKERVRAGDVVGHVREPLGIRFSVAHVLDPGAEIVGLPAWMHTWPALPWFTSATPSLWPAPTQCSASSADTDRGPARGDRRRMVVPGFIEPAARPHGQAAREGVR